MRIPSGTRSVIEADMLQRVSDALSSTHVYCLKTWWQWSRAGWKPLPSGTYIESSVKRALDEAAAWEDANYQQVVQQTQSVRAMTEFIRRLRMPLSRDYLPHDTVTLPAEPPAQPTVSLPSQ